MAAVDRLRRAYDRFNETGEFDWELLDPDVEWNAFRFAPVVSFHGHAGVRQWLLEVGEMFDGLRIDPEEFVDCGDKVVVVSTMRGRGRESGAGAEQTLVSVWTFRHERIVRHDSFSDRDEALREAGRASHPGRSSEAQAKSRKRPAWGRLWPHKSGR
jgi:ketosteroid isomerase-like protein